MATDNGGCVLRTLERKVTCLGKFCFFFAFPPVCVQALANSVSLDVAQDLRTELSCCAPKSRPFLPWPTRSRARTLIGAVTGDVT